MKAKKLPSGSWHCQVYSHTEHIIQPDGTAKDKRVYKSFTCDTSGPAGKRECERMAAEWAAEKSNRRNSHAQYQDMTLRQAIDKYIESREAIGRSASTIYSYQVIERCAFQDIMDVKLSALNERILQDAVERESKRKATGSRCSGTISAKRLKSEWGLIVPVLKKYRPGIQCSVDLPMLKDRVPELIPAETVFRIVKGTDIELPVLLAAWLSFTKSEICGLTKSKSIRGDYIRIAEVVVEVGGKHVRKEMAKNPTRNRTLKIPPYIKSLIDNVEGDVIVPMPSRTISRKWDKLLEDNGLPHMTFHDLRHLNASVMALLRVPDKYAQERGGWKSDRVMKQVYTQTFSDERERVDNIIDGYFEQIMQHEMQHES